MKTKIISFKNVSKHFYLQEDQTFKELLPHLILRRPWAKKFTALSNISFDIYHGETIGIIGRNGAGKSTILKLIAGVTTPSKGKVKINGQVAPMIEIGAGFHHELSGYENIFLSGAVLGIPKNQIKIMADQIIDFSELRAFIHYPVKKYSTGMYMRLGFSIAIHSNAPILLIDEVLAVGDIKFQEKCLKYLNNIKSSRDKTIILVSHDTNTVNNFCERVILVDKGKIKSSGTPKKILTLYSKILSKQEIL